MQPALADILFSNRTFSSGLSKFCARLIRVGTAFLLSWNLTDLLLLGCSGGFTLALSLVGIILLTFSVFLNILWLLAASASACALIF